MYIREREHVCVCLCVRERESESERERESERGRRERGLDTIYLLLFLFLLCGLEEYCYYEVLRDVCLYSLWLATCLAGIAVQGHICSSMSTHVVPQVLSLPAWSSVSQAFR